MSVENIKDVLEKVQNILDVYSLEKLRKEERALENEISSPGFWDDKDLAVEKNKQFVLVQEKIKKLEEMKGLSEELEISLELTQEEFETSKVELEKILKNIEKLVEFFENLTFLNGRFDNKNVLLSVHSGAGGVDAEDFAGMLVSMYQSFCKEQGWQSQIVEISSGDEGGVKDATLSISGEFAYGFLKEEAGVHRLIRISPFNSGNTRETSFALVECIPQGLEDEVEDSEIKEEDLKWDYFMSSGKGGQSVNTTYSAVRVTHLPTKTTVICQNERSQLQNKEQALKYLKNKLAILELKKKKEVEEELKGEFKSAEWGSQIRTYTLHPYKLVKDTRSGFESGDVDKYLISGKIMEIIMSVKKSKIGS